MANTVGFIRSVLDVKPTRGGKGLETTIKLVIYDNGMVSLNGKGFRDGRPSPLHSVGAAFSMSAICKTTHEPFPKEDTESRRGECPGRC